MLTRLEVNGFKNLLDLTVEFGPFTCIAGENGTGKSNVFDAIQFLSLLADLPMLEAAQRMRGVHDERTGDPRDLFWNGYAAAERRMSFAAEMIVPPIVTDDLGRQATPRATFLRYEVEIGYLPPEGAERLGRLWLARESLVAADRGRIRFPRHTERLLARLLWGRDDDVFISSADTDSGPRIQLHGPPGMAPTVVAGAPPSAVVRIANSIENPTLLAARRELQSWRRLALEPTALRTADRYTDPTTMGPDGRHLAATLYRVAAMSGAEDPTAVYARVANRLAELTGVPVRTIEVIADDVRELLSVELTETSGMRLPARSLSEGSLRFLALCVLLEDPSTGGLFCMEEPENGIHPSNLPAMVDLVRSLAVDPTEAPGDDNPFRQVIINTHSPGVVQLVDPADLLFATPGRAVSPDGAISRSLALRPLTGTWREATPAQVDGMTKADILPYLAKQPGARLSLGPDAA
ncbi:hypothetical protein Val02_84610 [Virgisporangium aliadipatigenens]|uniref:ATPase n=1 Tax=Virgisporangium aliadipatigenens TaxID=741659 RepID=A0A8J3YXL2_9ACTN|nr:AAA family ATPase [Virgisporangium aliadipatigenens]GIJ51575.1 hypothetical protein Val02_84610 [Virgisporangium aliadipatigenens]